MDSLLFQAKFVLRCLCSYVFVSVQISPAPDSNSVPFCYSVMVHNLRSHLKRLFGITIYCVSALLKNSKAVTS